MSAWSDLDLHWMHIQGTFSVIESQIIFLRKTYVVGQLGSSNEYPQHTFSWKKQKKTSLPFGLKKKKKKKRPHLKLCKLLHIILDNPVGMLQSKN